MLILRRVSLSFSPPSQIYGYSDTFSLWCLDPEDVDNANPGPSMVRFPSVEGQPIIASNIGNCDGLSYEAGGNLSPFTSFLNIKGVVGLSAGYANSRYCFALVATIEGKPETHIPPSSDWVIKCINPEINIPTILSVTSPETDATYGIGQEILVDVNFSEIVNTSTMTLQMDTGGTAVYDSGSGSSVIRFKYTVATVEMSADLDVSVVNSGDGKSATGKVIDTAIGSGNNLADVSAIVIDTVQPTITNINSALANGTYGITQVMDIIVTFNEVVNTTTSTLTLDTGGTALYLSGSGTNNITFRYTVVAGENSFDLNVVSVNIGDAVDADGNPIDTTLPGASNLADNKALVVDTMAPTITSISSPTMNGTYGITDTIDIIVSFDEAVLTSISSMTLDTGGTASYLSGNGTNSITFRYTVGATDNSTDLNVVSVTGGDAMDNAGNLLDNTLPVGMNLSDHNSIVINTMPPTVLSITPQGGAETGGTLVTIAGSGFNLSLTDVSIGGVSCTGIAVNSSSELTCTTGSNTGGYSDVVVTNPDTQFGSLSNGFLYSPQVGITSISQSSGHINGGETITIFGTNFVSAGVTSVDIGGVSCSNVSVLNSTTLTCDTSAQTAGQYDVNVNQYFQTATLSSAFTYIDGAVLSWQVGAGPPNPSNPADYGAPGANTTWTFTLENTGTSTSGLLTLAITGTDNTLWSIGTDNCTGNTLAPAATCTVQVTFLWDPAPIGSFTAILSADDGNGSITSNMLIGSKP